MSTFELKKIWCATDLTDATLPVDAAAMGLAKALGAFVTFHHVDETAQKYAQYYLMANGVMPPELVSARIAALYRKQEPRLHQRLSSLGLLPLEQFKALVTYGAPVEEILDEIRKPQNTPDLLVLARKLRPRIGELIIGSTADKLMNNCPVPTLLLPALETMRGWLPRKIMLATALEDESAQSENMATALASRLASDLEWVHVMEPRTRFLPTPEWAPNDAEFVDLEALHAHAETLRRNQLANKAQACAARSSGTGKVRATFLTGSITDELIHHTRTQAPDLLIIGQNRHSQLANFLLGNIAKTLTHGVNVPLLIVPHSKPA